MDGTIVSLSAVTFLKRRFASALSSGDERTAARLRAELDRLMNGPRAAAPPPPEPDLPPAA